MKKPNVQVSLILFLLIALGLAGIVTQYDKTSTISSSYSWVSRLGKISHREKKTIFVTRPSYLEAVQSHLPDLIDALGIQSMLHVPCGSFHWFNKMSLSLEHYIGVDSSYDLISYNRSKYDQDWVEFQNGDFLKDILPRADLILCIDVLLHLPFHQVLDVIAKFKQSGGEYLLTSTFPKHQANKEIKEESWRPLNLQHPPFNFPAPVILIPPQDKGNANKTPSFAVWKLSDLPG